MLIDWTRRRALERRMRGAAFEAAARALGTAVVTRTVDPVQRAVEQRGLAAEEVAFAMRVHGVAGHLVALDDVDRLPRPLVDAIRDEARLIAARADRLTADLRAIGHAARDAGLALVPLKGSFLRSECYASPALRPSSDIDLLIEASEIDAWRRVLRGRGYTREHATSRHRIFTRDGDAPAAVEGDHPDHPRPVELHARIADRVFGRHVDITEAYRDGLRDGWVLGDVPARVPGSAALALHLVLHAASPMLDRGLRLAQVLDFAFVPDDVATRASVHERLGEAAWAVMRLIQRDVPGLLGDGWLECPDRGAPSKFRQRIILSRPGLLRGDPYRLTTLSGELLLSMSPRGVAARVARSWRDRRAVR